jgi:hypothetical protein
LTPHLFFTATHNVRALPLSYVTKSLSAYRGAISTFSCQIYSRKKKEKKHLGSIPNNPDSDLGFMTS